jgi:hypothetical protein
MTTTIFNPPTDEQVRKANALETKFGNEYYERLGNRLFRKFRTTEINFTTISFALAIIEDWYEEHIVENKPFEC